MKVIDTGDIHDVPRAQVELTGEELHCIIVALDSVGAILQQSKQFAYQIRGENYEHLSQKLDDVLAALTFTPRTNPLAEVAIAR